ncbi:NINE protein [Paramicrobacterium sp. CJ85]|uniref:NINE protein n=1 Tax=Paramicrobacterium sp. CJ85 TaxID=3445355 RepID=UPI003F61C33C
MGRRSVANVEDVSDVVPTPPPPGFYPDQYGQSRWWDGTKWTEHTTYVAPYAYRPGQKWASTAYLLLFFLGGFGAHHFYLGKVGSGIVFIILWWVGWATTGIGLGILLLFACAIWLIVDIVTIPSTVRALNARMLVR